MSFIYNLTDTWSDGATAYSAIKMNVTNTASATASKLLDLQIGGSSLFTVDKTGGVTIARTTVTTPATTDGNVFSGTYTPTLSNLVNISASSTYVCQYMRVGNIVTVSGKITIVSSSTTTNTFNMSLPIPSNFSAQEQCAGSFSNGNASGSSFTIFADVANDNAFFSMRPGVASSNDYCFSFTYQVI
jgi:hypothetical protein